MSEQKQYVYCPFAYTNNNYARAGYGRHQLRFLNPVELPARGMLRGVLGGTGLAVAAGCGAPEAAFDFLRFALGPDVQGTLYTHAGGQPARCEAWDDPLINQLTADFFTGTRASIERSYIRPRYDGYIVFQEQAGQPLAQWLRGETSRVTAVEQMSAIYRQSRKLYKSCAV
jgi:multiple sugar transport system substrate-binding protein